MTRWKSRLVLALLACFVLSLAAEAAEGGKRRRRGNNSRNNSQQRQRMQQQMQRERQLAQARMVAYSIASQMQAAEIEAAKLRQRIARMEKALGESEDQEVSAKIQNNIAAANQRIELLKAFYAQAQSALEQVRQTGAKVKSGSSRKKK